MVVTGGNDSERLLAGHAFDYDFDHEDPLKGFLVVLASVAAVVRHDDIEACSLLRFVIDDPGLSEPDYTPVLRRPAATPASEKVFFR